jgi:hypothetical protein
LIWLLIWYVSCNAAAGHKGGSLPPSVLSLLPAVFLPMHHWFASVQNLEGPVPGWL